MPLRALTAVLLLLVTAPAASAQELVQGPDAGGFRNVLAVGQGSSASTGDVAANQATGAVPGSFVNQLGMYRDLLYKAPTLTAADLDRFFKPAPFGVPETERASVERPRPGVTIIRDRAFGVPRVYGATRADAMWGTGYVSGQERLFTMDVLRHYGRGRLSELAGAGRNDANVATDVGQLLATGYTEEELQAMVDRAAEYGQEGIQARQDLVDFTAGVNAWIAETQRDPAKLPGEYPLLGRSPAPWKPTDSVAAASLIGGIFGRGGGKEHLNGEVLQELRTRFGTSRARRVFNDLRRPEDPEAPVTVSRRFRFDNPGRRDRRAIALPDRGSVQPRNPIVSGSTAQVRAHGGQAGARLASNALLVSGKRSRSGRPLAVMGPQVEFYAPQILFEMEVHGPGIDARGATFPGVSLVVLIGRGRDFAWSATTATTDVVDVFAEELCEPGGGAPTRNSTHYRFRGECRPMDVRPHVLQVGTSAGGNTGSPRRIEMEIRRTVHGPVVATGTVGGKPVAFAERRSTYGHEVDAVIAFNRLNGGQVTDGRSFQRAMDYVPFAFNWFYAGPKEIAYLQSGWYPQRARGVDLDLPTWGTGEWEWRARRLPFERLPKAVDPPEGYLANWNGKQAPGWRAADDQWAFGSVQRVERFEAPLRRDLRRGGKVDLVRAVQVVELAATRDVRGQSVLPWALRVMRRTGHSRAQRLLPILERWSRGGAQRRDLDAEGTFEDSAAVALMDAWEPIMIRAIFEPVIGREAMEAATKLNPLIDTPPYNKGSGFGSGWYGHVQKDLRSVLGRKVRGPLSRRYCGRGRLGTCREALVSSLLEADAKVSREQGTDDPSKWRVRSTCTPLRSGEPLPKRCDQIEFQALGGISMDPIPWQDRPTFQQVVEVGGG
jgi:acyl-homoserine lactone acylase PvdQ